MKRALLLSLIVAWVSIPLSVCDICIARDVPIAKPSIQATAYPTGTNEFFYLYDSQQLWKVSAISNGFSLIEMPPEEVRVRNMISNSMGDLLWIVSVTGVYLWNSTESVWYLDPLCSEDGNCTRGIWDRTAVLSKDEKLLYALVGRDDSIPEVFLVTYDALTLTLYDMLVTSLPTKLGNFAESFRLNLTPNGKFLIASCKDLPEMALSIYDVSGDPRHPQLIAQYSQADLGSFLTLSSFLLFFDEVISELFQGAKCLNWGSMITPFSLYVWTDCQ